MRPNLYAFMIVLAGCGPTIPIDLQASQKFPNAFSNEQLSDKAAAFGRELETPIKTGENAVGFYANFNVGPCYFAVQGYDDGRLSFDAYWYSRQKPARCDQAPAFEQLKAALLTSV